MAKNNKGPKKGAKKAARDAAAKEKETAGVGNTAEPKNESVPDYVLISAHAPVDEGTKVTSSASVKGDQTLMIIDILQSRPVQVSIIETKPLTPGTDGTLVFVDGAVGHEWLTAAGARAKFAQKPDGTIIYNSHGFDDVPGNVDFKLVDVVKLVEFNHGKKGKKKKAE